MSHLGIAKVHKITTLQRISGEMLVLVEEKTNKSTLLLVWVWWWGCYGGTIEELVYCLISIRSSTSAKPPPPDCHILIMLRDRQVSRLLVNQYYSGTEGRGTSWLFILLQEIHISPKHKDKKPLWLK